jgi:nucleoside-diphosphate-sugar epimerase
MSPDEAALERELSEPTPETVAAAARWTGDLVVLGAGGKMGPNLARLAARSLREAGRAARVIAVSRFSTAGLRRELEADGVETIACDLMERSAVAALPDAAGVLFMAGQKFGTAADPAATWAANAYLPTLSAERYRGSRIVAFSTGNVYPLWPTSSEGPGEDDPVGPVGEYAQSALARERLLEFFSGRWGTPMTILRLNYAVEPRYGVLRDLADRIRAREPIDLAMGWVNLIWQRDACAVAFRALATCAVPPLVLNLTGPKAAVRWIAQRLAARWGVEPVLRGEEAATALLSNSARATALFGAPPTSVTEMIDRVAGWVDAGGRSLGKPTHFEERGGRF